MCEKYNGWTNYATWRVALEITTDYIDTLAREGEQQFDDRSDLAEHLKDYVDDCITGFGETDFEPAVSYARAFVSDVNFYELADVQEDYPSLFAAPESDEG